VLPLKRKVHTAGTVVGANGGYYLPCAQETGCTIYTSQPQRAFIYAPNTTYLAEAFLRIFLLGLAPFKLGALV
jgi:hypothetical protein